MAHRTCSKCGAADNPLSRLRFRKSRIDRKIYCENCESGTSLPEPTGRVPEELSTLQSVRHFPDKKPSAGLVVIACPTCAGGVHRPDEGNCESCAGYGSVRIEVAMLNVYSPPRVKARQVLTED